MGRPKKALELQKGHLTQKQQKEKEYQEQILETSKDLLAKVPVWLNSTIAKNEYKRLIEELSNIGIISNLDINNLGAYCNAYSNYRQATKELKGQPLTISYTNKNGSTNLIENPLIKIQLKFSDEMKKYASLLGLTIDSRLKLAALKVDKEDKENEEEFGDI